MLRGIAVARLRDVKPASDSAAGFMCVLSQLQYRKQSNTATNGMMHFWRQKVTAYQPVANVVWYVQVRSAVLFRR